MAQGFTRELPHGRIQGVDTEPGQDSGTSQNEQEKAQTRRSRVAGQCSRLEIDIEKSWPVRVYKFHFFTVTIS